MHSASSNPGVTTPSKCSCFWLPEDQWLSAASLGYGGGYEPASQQEFNPGCAVHGCRWKVACINWGHSDAPHAMTYRLRGGEMQAERYWATWDEAVAYVQTACIRPLWTDLIGIDTDYMEVSA